LLLKQGDSAAAEDALGRAQHVHPDTAWNLALLRGRQNDSAGAVAALETFLANHPDDPGALANLGLALWNTGRREQAADIFEQLMSRNQAPPEILLCAAALAVEAKDVGRAHKLDVQLCESGLPSAQLAFNIGVLEQESHHCAEAAVAYENALDRKPEFPEALFNLGIIWQRLGDETKTRQYLAAALALKPELAGHYFEPAA
jgi:tetratricopeptide (TPR) repeat protein